MQTAGGRLLIHYCVGCGTAMEKQTDRRKLQGPASEAVVNILKELCHEIAEEETSDIDADAWGFLAAKEGKMCRKCFHTYERYHSLHGVLLDNLKKTLNSPNSSLSTSAKRPRIESKDLPSSTSATSPNVLIQVGYKQPKRYILTPRRKHLGKAVARRSETSIAAESMKNPSTRQALLKLLGSEVRKEIRSMSAVSFLGSGSIDDLNQFQWDRLHRELSTEAPILLSILINATKTRVPRPNSHIIVGTCVSLLLKHRNPNMSLLQKMISIVLYAGHASKQVYDRLQKMNVSLSHSQTLRLLDKVGVNHDSKVVLWRESLISQMKSASEKTEVAQTNYVYCDVPSTSEESSCSDTDSQSDCSYQAVSPITSEEEYDSADSTDECEQTCPSESPPPIDGSTNIQRAVSPTLDQPSDTQKMMYRLCGDNIDKTVRQRYMRSDVPKPESIHYFHYYAVANRIDFSHLSEITPPLPNVEVRQIATSLLPTPDDDMALRHNLAILVSRILFQNLTFFQLAFDGVIEWHIKHEYYEQMSRKSEIVPLGIIPKNENKSDEMVDIMTALHKYVPIVEYTEELYIASIEDTVQVPQALLHPIILGGDQLTAARGRGAKKAKLHADTQASRLEGLVPAAEDWHTKVNLLEVIWKHFYSLRSMGDHGTLYQLRNRLNRTNVKDPKTDFNACDDFFVLVISCHIIAATLAMLKMESVDDTPSADAIHNPHSLWMESAELRKSVVERICQAVVNSYVDISFTSSNCNDATDKVKHYGKQLLAIGCLYLEFSDAIREGDGQRVLRCWRYLLPLFLGSHRTNYSCEVLNMLFQQSYGLSPRLSSELIWSRFINVHGRPGKNIPADLQMEHLNRLVKQSIKTLGPNKTEKAITRIGRAIGTVAPVLQVFDQENSVAKPSGAHHIAGYERDRNIIVSELIKSKVFTTIPGRMHSAFPNPRNILHAKEKRDVLTWMIERLSKCHV